MGCGFITRLGWTKPLWCIGNWCIASPPCSDITIRTTLRETVRTKFETATTLGSPSGPTSLGYLEVRVRVSSRDNVSCIPHRNVLLNENTALCYQRMWQFFAQLHGYHPPPTGVTNRLRRGWCHRAKSVRRLVFVDPFPHGHAHRVCVLCAPIGGPCW